MGGMTIRFFNTTLLMEMGEKSNGNRVEAIGVLSRLRNEIEALGTRVRVRRACRLSDRNGREQLYGFPDGDTAHDSAAHAHGGEDITTSF
jgi:hypothetical protein